MALALVCGQLLLVLGDQLVGVLFDGLIHLVLRVSVQCHLWNLNIGLKIVLLIFKGAEGHHLGDGADGEELQTVHGKLFAITVIITMAAAAVAPVDFIIFI